jgi:glycosyltransferase involved in cell wall biosynthesis
MQHIHQVNLQPIVGGGEVYTRSFTRALADAGARVTLYAHAGNRFWDTLAGERIERVAIASEEEFLSRLPGERAIVLTQGPISRSGVKRIAEKHFVAGVAHLPIQGGRDAEEFRPYHMVLGVSRYCIDLLRRARLDQTYPEPMYGVADAARGDPAALITAASPYQWDRRKGRDRLLGLFEPLAVAVKPRAVFERKSGLTLGIVSLIVPIKQFPLLFSHVGHILARHEINLEIFGAGGYAQVRDLKRTLAPMSSRVRFWGYQENVAAIYPKLDYLLTGLPEKEALGLNVLEAQICGTPVLAPRAPPFTETVLEGKTGLLYRDPREDAGADFENVIANILKNERRLDPRVARDHLAQFSYPALVQRAARLLAQSPFL